MKKRLLLFILIVVLVCGCCSCKKESDSPDGAVSDVIDKEQAEHEEDEPEQGSEEDKTESGTDDKIDTEAENKPESEPEDKSESESDYSEDGDCDHTFGEWKTEEKATCTKEGRSVRVCSKCNCTEKKTEPKSNHIEVVEPAVAATCAAEGKTEGKHCSFCYAVIQEQKSIPKKEHNFKNGYSCECGDFVESAKFVVMSQNVRYADDGENKNVSDRAPRFKQLVEKYNADIIGTQEATPKWNSFFKENLKDYGMIGCSRDGENAKSGEWGTILYRLDRFELIDSGTFWLSDTPDKVSRVSGSKCNRICTWALLKDKNTEKTFIMANTHLDHGTDEVRKRQMEILLDELSELMSKHPLILTGDFNATPDSEPYAVADKTLLDARTGAIEDRSLINYTFDSYGQSSKGKTIDYCFYNDKVSAAWYKVANDQFGGYVSDHYGVVTQFGIK